MAGTGSFQQQGAAIRASKCIAGKDIADALMIAQQLIDGLAAAVSGLSGLTGSGGSPVLSYPVTAVNVAAGTYSIPVMPSHDVQIFVNGQLQKKGDNEFDGDYTLTGTSIQFNTVSIPIPGSIIQAWYSS